MPESPRWLVARKGDLKAARRSLSLVHGLPIDSNQITHEVEAIQRASEAVNTRQSGWLDCFRPGPNKILYRTLLGMTLQAIQQLTGANYFFYYGATIFETVGLVDPYVTQIILGAVNFFCTFGGLWVMENVSCILVLVFFSLSLSLFRSFYLSIYLYLANVDLSLSYSSEGENR